jgi:hypothetical protein
MRRSIPIAACAIIMSLVPMFGQGPTLVGAGYANPTQIQVAPGQVATLFVSGLKTVLSQPLRATSLPLPNSLGGISVAVSQIPVPLLAVQQMSVCGNAGAPPPPPASPPSPTPECVITAITVQIPYEIATPQVGPGKSIYPRVNVVVTENGSDSKTFTIISVADKFHVLNTCDAFLFLPTNRIGGCNAVVTHGDGTVVTLDSPAKAGEVVVIYAFGLGATTPTPKTGQASPTPAAVLSSFVYFQFDFRPNATPSRPYLNPLIMAPIQAPVFVGLTPGQVGLYQINVKLPGTFPAVQGCNGASTTSGGSINVVYSNLTIDIAGVSSFDGAAICVQPPQ